MTSIKQSMRSISPAGLICRAATPTPGVVQGDNDGGAICDTPAIAGGTDAVYPAIPQCGGAGTVAFAKSLVTAGDEDTWQITLTTCANLTDCSGLVVDANGLSTIPTTCN
jgi:hypothetical protein